MFNKNNSAKFAFFYLLSLVSLGFLAVATGMVIFQIINKNIIDIVEDYQMRYNLEALRFAMSAIVVAAPVYYFSAWQINKNLFSGALDKDSGVRRWLSYLILFIASVVVIGYLIALINVFLNGELTLKFSLKTLTVLIISGIVFSYYFYDLKREQVEGKKNKIVQSYFYATLVLVLAVFIASFFFVESPAQARKLRQDSEAMNRLSSVASGVDAYYGEKNRLPADLKTLMEDNLYLIERNAQNPVTKKEFEYKVLGGRKYQLCTDFQTTNKNADKNKYDYYLDEQWQHDAGYQCVTRTAQDNSVKEIVR
jgi:type II secretory pathway pseudopilin PulG